MFKTKNSTGETSVEPFLKVIQAREDCVVFLKFEWHDSYSNPHVPYAANIVAQTQHSRCE